MVWIGGTNWGAGGLGAGGGEIGLVKGMLGQIHTTCTLLPLTSLERVMMDTQSSQQDCGPGLSHTQAQHTHVHADNSHGLLEPAVQKETRPCQTDLPSATCHHSANPQDQQEFMETLI